MKKILVTGSAGFIGFHLAKELRARGDFCIGIDNFNSYYDPKLKKDRADFLKKLGVHTIEGDIQDQELIEKLLETYQITHVSHLAAQAGIRHCLQKPYEYISSNVLGFVSILEACKKFPSIKITYASSSSVYGKSRKQNFSVEDRTDSPTNLYAATKKADELIAHAYHHLYGFSMIGLRYFTVYGPWGSPDMA